MQAAASGGRSRGSIRRTFPRRSSRNCSEPPRCSDRRIGSGCSRATPTASKYCRSSPPPRLRRRRRRISDRSAGCLARFHDAIAAALLQPVPLDRRHIVLARTKAIDTVSALEAPAVVDIARESAAMLHIVLMEAANDDATEIRGFSARTPVCASRRDGSGCRSSGPARRRSSGRPGSRAARSMWPAASRNRRSPSPSGKCSTISGGAMCCATRRRASRATAGTTSR